MINSRDIEYLATPARVRVKEFLSKADAEGIDLLVTSTYRDDEAQAALYAQGRTTKGRIVTNARPGESWHNWRCAVDVVPMRYGKPVWSTSGPDAKLWNRIGAIGESCGLEWAGRWTTFREYAHFQYTGGLTIAQLQAGETIA